MSCHNMMAVTALVSIALSGPTAAEEPAVLFKQVILCASVLSVPGNAPSTAPNELSAAVSQFFFGLAGAMRGLPFSPQERAKAYALGTGVLQRLPDEQQYALGQECGRIAAANGFLFTKGGNVP